MRDLERDFRSSDTAAAELVVNFVRGQIERLTKLSTDLLDLSRLDADALTLQSEPSELRVAANDPSFRVTRALRLGEGTNWNRVLLIVSRYDWLTIRSGPLPAKLGSGSVPVSKVRLIPDPPVDSLVADM